MKYLCLVYSKKNALTRCPTANAWRRRSDCAPSGHVVAAEALHPVDTATTLRVRNGALSMTDGPFAETKEQLAGFYLSTRADLDEAIQLAAKIPPVHVGSIEVRPVRELDPNA